MLLLYGGSVPFYWVTLYCMGDKRCLSSYFENFCIVFLGEELKTRVSLDKKFIILSEIDQKIYNLIIKSL